MNMIGAVDRLTKAQIAAIIDLSRHGGTLRPGVIPQECWSSLCFYNTSDQDYDVLHRIGAYVGSITPSEHVLHMRIKFLPVEIEDSFYTKMDRHECGKFRLHITDLTVREEKLRPLRRVGCRDACRALLTAASRLLPIKDLRQMLGRALWETRGYGEWYPMPLPHDDDAE